MIKRLGHRMWRMVALSLIILIGCSIIIAILLSTCGLLPNYYVMWRYASQWGIQPSLDEVDTYIGAYFEVGDSERELREFLSTIDGVIVREQLLVPLLKNEYPNAVCYNVDFSEVFGIYDFDRNYCAVKGRIIWSEHFLDLIS